MHPVIELIRQRKLAKSLPGKRTDPFKLGLAIEGGGMRGLVTSGMGSALEHLGLLNVFDVVYGTSAGGFNGAYLIAEQANYGGTIYYQNINNRRFIDLKRLIMPAKSVMSLEFLVWEVAQNLKVLDCAKIIASPIPFVILVSSVRELCAKRLRDFKQPDDVLRALLATARMPVIAGGPVEIEGEFYFDGGVFEAIPYHSAVDEGCTHILTFLSRPDGKTLGELGVIQKLLTRHLLKEFRGIEEALGRRPETHFRDTEYLREKTENQDGPPYIYSVQPPAESDEVDRLERSRELLVAGAVRGFEEVYKPGILQAIYPRSRTARGLQPTRGALA